MTAGITIGKAGLHTSTSHLRSGAVLSEAAEIALTNAETRLAQATETAAIQITLPNSTRGWNAGDPINNLTRQGNVPKWNTVRQRYWKNEAYYNASAYSERNIERMQGGLAS